MALQQKTTTIKCLKIFQNFGVNVGKIMNITLLIKEFYCNDASSKRIFVLTGVIKLGSSARHNIMKTHQPTFRPFQQKQFQTTDD